jgi:hypothetical protein
VDVRQRAGEGEGTPRPRKDERNSTTASFGRSKPGCDLFHKLEKRGKSYAEALDLALESVIPKDGPEFSDNPPKPLSLDDQEKVYRKIERRQEIMDLLSELRSKRP